MFSVLRKQFRRLSIQLTLWNALLFLAAALAMLSLEYLIVERGLRAHERTAIESKLNQYAGEYQHGGLDAVRRIASFKQNQEIRPFFVRIADQHNRTLFLRDPDEWVDFAPNRLAENEPVPPQRGWLTLNSRSGAQVLIAYLRLSDGSLVQVGKSDEELQGILAGFRQATLLVLLVFLPASIVGGAFVASRVLHPMQHLSAVAEKIVATASFDARVPSRGTDDELDALVRIFNKMLDRIEDLIRGMRDSLDNVAHDLRTPMTRLRNKAQTVLGSDENLEMTRDALADCVEEAERAMSLLNMLMDIAEAEAGLTPVQHAPVEVAELVRFAVESYAEVAEEKGVTVSVDAPPSLFISGDAGSLRRVFANLLDNAIKYTPAQGRVRVSAETSGNAIVIHFADTGSGISAEDLPRIWDRLFRGDRSRSERGLGLGLSFVRAIVHLHGGATNATSQPGAGTTVSISLPIAEGGPVNRSVIGDSEHLQRGPGFIAKELP
jgi:signal transduction histidine kinase